MTVYVTQETSHDFTSAEAWGEVKFITASDFNNIRGSISNRHLMTDISRCMKKFDPDTDWIIIAGSPYVAAMVFMLLGERGFRYVNILRWDNRDLKYIPLHLAFNPGNDESETIDNE